MQTQSTPPYVISDHAMAEFYGRRIIDGLLSHELTTAKARTLGRMAGSYARRALATDRRERRLLQFEVRHGL